jgi:hypothetical protein
MTSVVGFPKRDVVNDSRGDNPLADQTLALLKTLLQEMPDTQKQRVARELLKLIGHPEAPKAGDALATVLSIMKRQPEFTVADVKKEVAAQGADSDPKEIYNALGYMKRRGKIRRVAYGRYVVDGVEIDTLDDLGGETTRYEDEYQNIRNGEND